MLFCSRSPDRIFAWNQSEYLHNLQLYRLRRWRSFFVVLRPIWIYVITSDVRLMLDHSLRRWPNNISTLLVVMICIQYCLSFAPSGRPGQHLLVSIIPSWDERSLIACDLVNKERPLFAMIDWPDKLSHPLLIVMLLRPIRILFRNNLCATNEFLSSIDPGNVWQSVLSPAGKK